MMTVDGVGLVHQHQLRHDPCQHQSRSTSQSGARGRGARLSKLIKVMVGAVWEPSAPTGAPPLPPNPPFSRKSNLGGFEDLRGAHWMARLSAWWQLPWPLPVSEAATV